MTLVDRSPAESAPAIHVPVHPVRFVTAASLFDGHDASINIMRRILQSQGAEVIHLGHNRSVDEVVRAAVQEDVQAVAVSSYQGGHVEYFRYLLDRLRDEGRGDVRVYGGGGRRDRARRDRRAARRTASPASSRRTTASASGSPPMVNTIIAESDVDLATVDRRRPRRAARRCRATASWPGPSPRSRPAPTATTSCAALRAAAARAHRAGPRHHRHRRVGQVVAHRRAGPPLPPRPGRQAAHRRDRHRPDPPPGRRGPARRPHPHERARRRATCTSARSPPAGRRARCRRRSTTSSPRPRWPAHDLVIVETPGIGQGDAAIVDHVDVPLYVMTAEFGAPSQLEKIDMLDFADVVAINKFDRRGAEDALRDVRRQMRPQPRGVLAPTSRRCRCSARWRRASTTTASPRCTSTWWPGWSSTACRVPSGVLPRGVDHATSSRRDALVPPDRVALPGRDRRHRARLPRTTTAEVAAARRRQHVATTLGSCARPATADAGDELGRRRRRRRSRDAAATVRSRRWPNAPTPICPPTPRRCSTAGRPRVTPGRPPSRSPRSRGRRSARRSSARRCRASTCPASPCPRDGDDGELLRFLRAENLPGRFPFTAGVFPFKRDGEDPARMFAGEGDAFRTNRRFHLLAEGQPATRLSTAFDSVTLYGFDPDERPDIYGKVGNSGVSIATLDDMKVLYDGFDLCDPSTSVSMTINGPAPTILAMFLNTAIDQQLDAFAAEHGRTPDEARPPTSGPTCCARAGHGAGRHPQGGPGPEHLHLLDRVLARGDGRHRRVVRRARGAQLLLGVDLRLPHRRGRREPHQPARLHAGQRVHLRRGLPGPGHGHRRLRPQPRRSSSPTGWTPSTRCSAGWPGASGPSPCATATAPTSGPRS